MIALGLLFAQGPSLLHLLLVPHATCEHGELIDAVDPGGAVSAVGVDGEDSAPAASASFEKASGPAADRSRAARSEHDHCDALAVRHRVPELALPVAPASLAWIVAIPGDGRPLPLLALAPKGSPPRG